MIINEKVKKLTPINWSDFYVVADFDRTITKGSSKTSWSILASSDMVPAKYKEERDAYYKIYRPIEIDETMEPVKRNALVKEWFIKHIELFVKYQIKEELFENAAKNLRIMEFRDYGKNFIDFLHEKDIPLVIISAGIGNFIEYFFKNNACDYDNIYISSNKIIFKDGVASGVDTNIIHSLNKNEVSLPDEVKDKLRTRKNVLLLGDQKSDLNMVDETLHDTVIKVCFLNEETSSLKEEYSKYFDIIIEENEDYKTLMDILS